MKTLIQKELKENLKLAAVCLLTLALILLVVWHVYDGGLANLLAGRAPGAVDGLQPLLANGFVASVVAFCAIFGATLGWRQGRSETQRDLWAFLVHRPVTRTEIFWAKSLAGLCLYFLCAGLPPAVFVLVARTPGFVAAPFEWAMTLPLVFGFLAGIVFYFAGLLTGLRQARWYGSRGLGLAPAVFTLVGVFTAQAHLGSLLWITVGVVVLAVTVWGAFQSGGFYRGQPLAGKRALSVVLAAGCGGVLFVSLGLFLNLVIEPFTHGRAQVYSFYQMTREGDVYQVTLSDGDKPEVVDLAGHPLLDPKTGQKMEYKEFQKRRAYGRFVVSTLVPRPNDRSLIESPVHFFNLLNITDNTLWYLDRHGHLLGFDARTRRFIGFLNPPGHDGASDPELFLPPPAAYYYYIPNTDISRRILATAKTVYVVDFKERAVNPVFSVTNDDEIGAYSEGVNDFDGTRGQNIFITTRKLVCLMDSHGQALVSVPYLPAYAEYPEVDLSVLYPAKGSEVHYAVWFYPDSETNQAAGWKMPVHVLWVGADHTITKSADLPVLRQSDAESWTDQVLMMMTLPVLHVLVETGHWTDAAYVFSSWHVAGYALALVFAVAGGWMGKRYNLSTGACAGWVVFILLLGLPGLLAMLCAEDWPRREACPNCRRLRVVDRELCEHCAAPFPPPVKNGTEIFAPLVKA